MNISAKTEYAAVAMLELATHYGTGEPLRIRNIADTHGIPSRFLVQILLQLKGAGLVSSTRGAAGGYQLAKEPSQITLGEVMGIVEGQAGQLSSNTSLNTPISQVLLNTWQQISNVQQEKLQSITLADLVDEVRGQTENMYYI